MLWIGERRVLTKLNLMEMCPAHAITSFSVDQPAATPTAALTQSAADMYFVPAVVGIIVAIVIVGAVLALLMLRKRA